MLYEETEKKEIERVYAVFADYIRKARIWNGSGLTSWAICF